ncbi:hypothetical protein [Archangium primigenium]|uniref:hypothetical protein n=1 Tax=[Archangium] primigenium TaxID=2792470 RepID=UPI00195DA3E1|nr:hypothetical protein [Archangium primigenium]MBM7114262.1 hypothetical protein [Archangium primigenium]
MTTPPDARVSSRLLLAGGMLTLWLALTWGQDTSATSTARMLWGALVLGAGLFWWCRRGWNRARFPGAEPLRVVARTGLSQRCGVAVLDVEGRHYLVVFGDSFAEIRRTRGPVLARPRPERPRMGRAVGEGPLS